MKPPTERSFQAPFKSFAAKPSPATPEDRVVHFQVPDTDPSTGTAEQEVEFSSHQYEEQTFASVCAVDQSEVGENWP